MDTYTHDQESYMNRMNQTARSKFDLLQKHLAPDISILDFGSGYSPEFIDAVVSTGASYTACDHSPIVQEKLQAHGANWLTPQTLATVEEEVEYYGLSDEELEQRKSYAPDINYTYPISDIESFRDQLISITDRCTIPYWYDKESNKFVQVIE